jgi:hypothetical protein
MQKKKSGGSGETAQVIPNQMSYVDTIYLGCGEPGHFKQSCDKADLGALLETSEAA